MAFPAAAFFRGRSVGLLELPADAVAPDFFTAAIRMLMKAFKQLGSAPSTYHKFGQFAGSSIWQVTLTDRPRLATGSATFAFSSGSSQKRLKRLSFPSYSVLTRPVSSEDAGWMTALRNDVRRRTMALLDEEDCTPQQTFDWIQSQKQLGYPTVVANVNQNHVGYATLTPFRDVARRGCEL